MAVGNSEIAEIFREMADVLEIQGANRYRVQAYRNAAFTVEDHRWSMAELIDEGADLTELPGIGEELASTIREIVETGRFSDLEALRGEQPDTLRDLLKIPGLGPKRVQTLHEELGVDSLESLREALEAGKVRDVPGFGEKTIATLRETVASGRQKKERRLRASVEAVAEDLASFLQAIPGVEQSAIAGSYRRRRETVADLDAVAASKEPAEVIDRFVEYSKIERIVSHGDTRATVVLADGLPVDLRAVQPESYGAALLYFTSGKDHQIRLRDAALVRGWKLNEYGLFDEEEQRVAGATEAEIYTAFNLPYIEPELREERGEIEAARAGELPDLITLADLRGDLHCHTADSDGASSLEEMTRAALDLGREYLAITDHSRYGRDDPEQIADELARQADEIDRLNAELDGITILKGIEVDIEADGSLGLPNDLLASLDIVVCSIHDHFDLSREEQTERLLRAIENPYCQIIAHPSGRLVNEPNIYEIDLEQVLEAAHQAGCVLELNADPERLDLDDRACKRARELGVLIAINSDAHSSAELANLRHGVGQARRGWLEAIGVINTRSLNDLQAALRHR